MGYIMSVCLFSQAWLAINFLRLSTLARGCSARHAVATGTMRSGVAFLLLIARSGILDRRRSLTISLFVATPGVTSLAQSQTRVARAESALKRRYRSCAADQLYLWRAARAAGSAVPSSAQQLCLCFLGSRVALFRIGCLVQLQQSLRSLVLLLRMRRLRSQRLQCSIWPPARSKTVPSSAQRHCLCFLAHEASA